MEKSITLRDVLKLMNMRRFFIIFSVLLSVLAVNSCRLKVIPENPSNPETENPEVEPPTSDQAATSMLFYVTIPQSTSENDADISLLDELHYALYSTDSQNISYVQSPEAYPIVRSVLTIEDGTAEVELGLAGDLTGHEFVLILWAQKYREEGQEFYDLADLRNVKCAGEVTLCNQEERVAYYLTHKFAVTSVEYAEELTLSRPHARLNLGTFTQSLSRPDGSTLRLDQSEVHLTGVSASFNTIAGLDNPNAEEYGAAGEAVSETFTYELADVPQKSIVINEREYPYLALNYFFVSSSVNVDFVIKGTPISAQTQEQSEGQDQEEPHQATFVGTLSGINAYQGYTTTIIGHFFGADGRFEYDFRLQVGEGGKGGSTIMGDEDGDGLYDDPMDWGWSLGGDDSASGGGGNNGDAEIPDFDGGEDDEDDEEKEDEEKKEDVRIEGPDAVTWEVYTLEGLYMWAEEARTSSGASFRVNLKLLADIYMTEPWVPVDFTAGTIDGQGHTIYDMVIEGDKNLGFLLKTNQYIEVGNLNFENVRISGTTNLGVVAAADNGKGLISNCHVLSGSVSGTTNVGGIVGNSTGYYAKYYDCSNNASISGTGDVGGIVGDAYWDTITRCTNKGTVTCTGEKVGGICGNIQYSVISDCVNHGDIIGQNYAGGICGRGAVFVSCINHGNIQGVNYVGGISGTSSDYSNNCSSDCTNYGAVTGNTSVGGTFGKLGSAGELLRNYGNVEGVSNVGGISGIYAQTNKSITQCINEANITGTNNIGGIVGYFDVSGVKYSLTLSNNNTSGTITGATNVEQLVGLSDGTVVDDGTNITSGKVVIVQPKE